MQGLGRPDIVNVGSGETRYSECRVRGRPDIVNAGSGETRYSECRVLDALGREGTARMSTLLDPETG
ncbi:unnamed protein product [Staurois parvus]|uniref:Uncharacterized protein n=1 Tax=Staurois parvus TaxID=386267 RepID=A0ABN9HSH5_9NEOB|nr:unnamed protein product [Staurois parvus]